MQSRDNNPLSEKSLELGIECVRFSRRLKNRGIEPSIATQFIRSATAPGALIAEAKDSESKADMHHKFGIALKESREAMYWSKLIEATATKSDIQTDVIIQLLNEVTAMLVASRKTLKESFRTSLR